MGKGTTNTAVFTMKTASAFTPWKISVIHGRRSLSPATALWWASTSEPAGGSPEVAVHAGTRYPGEIERVFNQSMAAPDRWADLVANLLGRREELRHTTLPFGQSANGKPNCEAELEAQARQREQELQDWTLYLRHPRGGAKLILAKRSCKSRYQRQVSDHAAFSEHGTVPLKTQGWIINTTQYSIFLTEWSMELPLP